VSAVEPNSEPTPEEYPAISEPAPYDDPATREPSFGGEHPTLQEAAQREAAETADAGRPRRGAALHRADPVSIGVGLVFFLIGGAYLLASGGHLTVNAGWTLSLLLLGLGLSGVVGGLLNSRRRGR
jgi:hypothetical protein